MDGAWVQNSLLCFDSDLDVFYDSTPSNSQEEPKVKVELIVGNDIPLPTSPAPLSPQEDVVQSPSSSDDTLHTEEISMDLGETLKELGITVDDPIPDFMGENEISSQALQELLESTEGTSGGYTENMSPTEEASSTTEIAEYVPGSVMLSTGLTEEELVSLPVKELNRRVAGVPKDQQKRLKAMRRTLKNRGYAQICRTKRILNNDLLMKENDELKTQLASVIKERDMLIKKVAYCNKHHA